MQATLNINSLSPHLFWDVDKATLHPDEHKSLIIHRVLEYGLMNDWKLLIKGYGLNTIQAVSQQLRTLDDVTLAFLCTIFHLEKTDFRCYRLRQSTQSSWNY